MAQSLSSTAPSRPDRHLTAVRRLAIVPALNEAGSVEAIIREIRAQDPEFEVLVVDDGSTDGTSAAAATAGARVITLPFNVGIGGAVQTGYQYALEHGFDVGIPRRQPEGAPALRSAVPARLSRGRVDRPPLTIRTAHGRGAGADARAR